MGVPFCDNPECKYNKILVGADVKNLIDNGIRIKRKKYYDNKTNKGYYYCKDCYNKISESH